MTLTAKLLSVYFLLIVVMLAFVLKADKQCIILGAIILYPACCWLASRIYPSKV